VATEDLGWDVLTLSAIGCIMIRHSPGPPA
jgi:hypothetical protein